MSIEAFRLAWQTDLPHGSDKLVLLALADYASDKGEAWPSNSTIGTKCSRSEQTVRDALRRLAEAGHVTRIDRAGQTSIYRIHPIVTPPNIQGGSENHKGSEYHNPHPSQDLGGTPPKTQGGPLPISRPKPSIEPPMNPQVEPSISTRANRPDFPDWLPRKEWDAFADMRKGMKSKLTDHAVDLSIRKLADLRDQGHDPAEVLNQSTMHGWKGLFEIKDNRNGSRNGKHSGSGSTDGFLTALREVRGGDVPSANPMLRRYLAGRE
jgi:hypothetical protein